MTIMITMRMIIIMPKWSPPPSLRSNPDSAALPSLLLTALAPAPYSDHDQDHDGDGDDNSDSDHDDDGDSEHDDDDDDVIYILF